jgi:hypothetical protein
MSLTGGALYVSRLTTNNSKLACIAIWLYRLHEIQKFPKKPKLAKKAKKNQKKTKKKPKKPNLPKKAKIIQIWLFVKFLEIFVFFGK